MGLCAGWMGGVWGVGGYVQYVSFGSSFSNLSAPTYANNICTRLAAVLEIYTIDMLLHSSKLKIQQTFELKDVAIHVLSRASRED